MGAVPTGSFYGFSVYSVSLKHQCGLSQVALANINTLPYVLGLGSPLVGMITRPLGARLTMLIGGLIVAGGLCAEYILATRCSSSSAVRSAAPVLLVACACMVYVGNICCTSVAFPAPVQFWPQNRSQVCLLYTSPSPRDS